MYTLFKSFSRKNPFSLLNFASKSLLHDSCTKSLLNEFPEPKRILWNLINQIHFTLGAQNIKPVITEKLVHCDDTKQSLWNVTIEMSWPEKFQVEARARKKTEAETLSFLYACQKLKKYSLLDEENKPKIPDKFYVINEKLLKSSKCDLINLYEKIWMLHKRKDFKPQFHFSKIEGIFGKNSHWNTQLSLSYPENKLFEGCSTRLKEADSIAAAKALLWLREKYIISKKNRLLQYSVEEESKLHKSHLLPNSIYFPESLQTKISSVLDKVKVLNDKLTLLLSEGKTCDANEIFVQDVITDKKYNKLSEEEIMTKSQEMINKNRDPAKCDSSLLAIKETASKLPIFTKRAEILKTLEENQVVVLSGETGCGKTTQVPQFILDHCIDLMKGAACNIVVTQPRRISAVSVAARVAAERGEEVGDTIGHQVRLNRQQPKGNGSILYCTTGMLLRKLCFNPTLQGVSHVIVDEVHERNIQIDFLLILLKRILESNGDIRVLVMSASFNTSVFSQYFCGCPVIHVPGKVYPVDEYFLEDFKDQIPGVSRTHLKDPVLDPELVVSVIRHIMSSQKPGAILCFLPGWHDILTVKNKLSESCKDPSALRICCAHSSLPHEEQRLVFDAVPPGVRKVVLATNIAETSITIDDVVFVVNSGLHKCTSFDGEQGVASLATQWITRANARQRRGRAGRVQSGECYNLFSRRNLMDMEEYVVPELQRMPLESVILDCKLYCPDTKAEDFLSRSLQPPSRSALQSGVNELQTLGVLDENENLTDLGRVVVNFSTHPRLSVSLVYAAFLGCLDPVLTICALLTLGKEPFQNTLEDKSVIKMIKQGYDNNLYSDHLALQKVYETWSKFEESPEKEEFLKTNILDEQSLLVIKGLKALFAEDLLNAGVIDNNQAYMNSESKCNRNSKHIHMILAALSVAFYPNVIKVMQGEVSHGRLNKDSVVYSLLKGQRGYIQKESVASGETELPSPWLIYFSALQSESRRLMMTSEVSPVPAVCLPLLAGSRLEPLENDSPESSPSDSITLVLDGYRKLSFSCSPKEAHLLTECRAHVRFAFENYVKHLKAGAGAAEALENVQEELLSAVKEVLETPQVPFTKGQLYKFVDGDLVVENV